MLQEEDCRMTATTLYSGGTVLVLDGHTPPAGAAVVRDGRIAATGTRRDMESLAGRGATHVDLQGATLMPGLIDTHPHVLHFGGLSHHLVDLSDAGSHSDILERIGDRAKETAEGEWIIATPVGEPHYFIRRSWRDLEEGALPNRELLDRATSAHPVFIQAWAPVTPNVCALSSAALAKLGITRETPDRVENVWVEKDERGEPTGILRGSVNNYYSNDPFMNGLLRQVPFFEPSSIVPGTRRAMADYNRLGVTAVYEGHAMGAMEIEIYRMLRRENALTTRVLTSLEAEPCGLPWTETLSMEQFDANLELALSMTDVSDELLRSSGVTVGWGGPCWPGLLLMNEPYSDPYGEPTRGVELLPKEKVERAMTFCAERGVRFNFVGGSEREHDELLPILETLAKKHEIRGRRWVLQHAILMNEEHTRRYAALGFQITTSMTFSWGKGDLYSERIGEHVRDSLGPLRRLLDAGLTVACGSDWGPKNVFEQIELAQTHRFCGSGYRNLGPAQPVTREEAVLMWTRDAARVLGWEGIGTLAPGNHADLTVVDRNPLCCELEDLATTRVLRTVLAGETVFDSGEL
jgi:predicted amidohydrolase YtcJ